MEKYQAPPNDEWGIDMNEAIDVFNMDVGEEFRVSKVNDQMGQSSTQPDNSQMYVHMTNNVIHIKILITKKDNP